MNNLHKEQLEIEEVSHKKVYFSIIESLLYASGDPISLSSIASIIECSVEYTEKLMKDIMKIYKEDESRGIKIIKNHKEYQFVTKPKNSSYIQKLLKTNVRQSLSQAALETLSIIAYRQPITRVEIEEIRGVKSDRAIYTLIDKNLIKESGKKDVVGRPNLYGTTDEFLKYFDFGNIDELPSLETFNVEEIESKEEIETV
ncbi:SMC-Scp complex subunit ScpB [Clostridium senegalense]|uniref:Segregation and condensation protein B n=1 Tax=Clostridium senegalense TaxID=1465809 RepID=A0A6M0GYT1_9CLOT|nr:SMC-Scp complex subunit ScpB [Clostridium senegalense]NEU03605.1 segregation/condensation protein B [Clostridium senegalense]